MTLLKRHKAKEKNLKFSDDVFTFRLTSPNVGSWFLKPRLLSPVIYLLVKQQKKKQYEKRIYIYKWDSRELWRSSVSFSFLIRFFFCRRGNKFFFYFVLQVRCKRLLLRSGTKREDGSFESRALECQATSDFPLIVSSLSRLLIKIREAKIQQLMMNEERKKKRKNNLRIWRRWKEICKLIHLAMSGKDSWNSE